MTINTAIEVLEMELHLAERQPETGINDALKLGIEALKAIQNVRKRLALFSSSTLPGETET